MNAYEQALNAIKAEQEAQGRELVINNIFEYCKSNLPDEMKSRPWEYINHGVELLNNDIQLDAYIAAYGEMHKTKCSSVFQQLNPDIFTGNFEIFDWGCGQGIGTMSFMEILKEWGRISMLKSVTLIEPSSAALSRASYNIHSLNPNVEINTINRFLPGDGLNDEVESITYTYRTVIHIFSNILDIETINLQSLANLISKPNHKQIIFCVGPMNSGCYRIHAFADMFRNSVRLIKCDEVKFGRTRSTKHDFSRCADCFIYSGDGIKTLSAPVTPVLVNGEPIYNDYDDKILLANNILDKEEFAFYSKLQEGLTDDDYIFVKPNINGDTPIILIIRPNIGVLIVTTHSNNDVPLASIEKIKSYQRNMIELHVKDLLAKALQDSNYWATIQKVILIKDGHIKDFIEEFHDEMGFDDKHEVNTQDLNFTHIIDSKKAHQMSGNKLLKYLKMDAKRELFRPMICQNFVRAVSANWHSYKSGIEIYKIPEQQKLMISRAGAKQKINGAAGSGKTQVLTVRAVNSQLRTGGRVLVLSYNITLKNYLEDRMNEVRKDFSWDDFDIMNYHQFFNAQANNLNKKVKDLSAYEDLDYFDNLTTPKYAAILIDEVQDYKKEWLTILDKYFLDRDGEFVVFGDAKQNVYRRPLGINGEIMIGAVIGGRWNNSLSKSFRSKCRTLAILANNFQKQYYDNPELVSISEQIEIDFTKHITYKKMSKGSSAENIYKVCNEIINQCAEENPEEDVRGKFAILSQSVDVLRDVESLYCNEHGKNKTMTTFENQKQYDIIQENYKYSLKEDLDAVRASKKRHFKITSTLVKLSTIQSFKGLEAENVILILQPVGNSTEQNPYRVPSQDNNKELIYVGITRAKSHLYIIDLENQQYGAFFKNQAEIL